MAKQELNINLGQHMGQVVQPETVMLQDWQMHPLLNAQRAEVLKNLRDNLGKDVEARIVEAREVLLKYGVLVVGVLIPSAGGKGSILSGLRDLFNQDPFLKQQAEKSGKKLRIRQIFFTSSLYASEIAFPEMYPNGQPYGNHTKEHYDLATSIHRQALRETIEDARSDDAYLDLILVEPAAMAIIPVVDQDGNYQLDPETGNLVVEGNDRCVTPLLECAIDPATREFVRIFSASRDLSLADKNVDIRATILNEQSFRVIYEGKDYSLVITVPGKPPIKVSELPQGLQREMAIYYSSHTAPPRAMAQSDAEIDEILFKHKGIRKPDFDSHLAYIAKVLKLTPNQFIHVANHPFSDKKTIDLGYFFVGNVILLKYPDILKNLPNLRRFVLALNS